MHQPAKVILGFFLEVGGEERLDGMMTADPGWMVEKKWQMKDQEMNAAVTRVSQFAQAACR